LSYDLYFTSRTGVVDRAKILAYFSSRPHYKIDPPQVLYGNEDTGVYFHFEMRDENKREEPEHYPIAMNMNYFRPSYFVLEAEPEVTAFVRKFDLIVFDPQMHGMGTGEYDPELLKSGWHHGNEFAYSVMLRDPKKSKNSSSMLPPKRAADVWSLPSASLLKAWSWNLSQQAAQGRLGETKFVPRVMFVLLEGNVVTAAIWPDGIPIAVPDVDYLIVPRKKLAPRRTEDRAIVTLKDALPVLQKYGTPDMRGTLILNYDTPTGEIATYVTSLPMDKRELKGLSPDQVLDRELVAKYAIE
jgi:hypothetical protein